MSLHVVINTTYKSFKNYYNSQPASKHMFDCQKSDQITEHMFDYGERGKNRVE